MRHCGVARRIRAQSPVMRAIGCSTNSRQDASAPCSASGGVAGFSCDARTAPWACPSARVESVSAFSRPPAAAATAWSAPTPDRPANKPDAGTCSRSVAARCLRRTQFNSSTSAATSGSSASIGGNSGILVPDGFGAVSAGFTVSPAAARNAPAAPTTRPARARWCVDSCRARHECSARSVSSTPAASSVSWRSRASPAARWFA